MPVFLCILKKYGIVPGLDGIGRGRVQLRDVQPPNAVFITKRPVKNRIVLQLQAAGFYGYRFVRMRLPRQDSGKKICLFFGLCDGQSQNFNMKTRRLEGDGRDLFVGIRRIVGSKQITETCDQQSAGDKPQRNQGRYV